MIKNSKTCYSCGLEMLIKQINQSTAVCLCPDVKCSYNSPDTKWMIIKRTYLDWNNSENNKIYSSSKTKRKKEAAAIADIDQLVDLTYDNTCDSVTTVNNCPEVSANTPQYNIDNLFNITTSTEIINTSNTKRSKESTEIAGNLTHDNFCGRLATTVNNCPQVCANTAQYSIDDIFNTATTSTEISHTENHKIYSIERRKKATADIDQFIDLTYDNTYDNIATVENNCSQECANTLHNNFDNIFNTTTSSTEISYRNVAGANFPCEMVNHQNINSTPTTTEINSIDLPNVNISNNSLNVDQLTLGLNFFDLFDAENSKEIQGNTQFLPVINDKSELPPKKVSSKFDGFKFTSYTIKPGQ